MRNAAPWLRPLLLILAALLLISLFTGEISDNDVYWHLRSGQYIVETHSLPVPDPFSFTSTGASYPGEEITRRFNLTHEWLAQIVMFGVYKLGGFPGLVLVRAFLLLVFCGVIGWIAFRRAQNFYMGLTATLAAGGIAFYFAQSRPFLATFVFLACTIAIFETRRHVWLLPLIFLVWANCHSGFILGWIVLAVYCLKSPLPAALAFLASAINPNGLRVIQALWFYRFSGIQTTNLEWQRPIFWTPGIYSFLLFAPLLVMLIAWRRVRAADWLLYFAFAGISLLAVRNTIFIGLAGPILLATYLPAWPPLAPVALVAAAAALLSLPHTDSFAFHAAQWQPPTGAAAFIESHHLTGRMFNSYEDGGYLIWRLWPAQRVFIDARGLSEAAFDDYRRILYDTSGGKTATALLDKYKIDMLVVPGFDYLSGQVYPVAVETKWTLAYADAKGFVYLRNPPSGITSLNHQNALLDSLAAQCQEHVTHDPIHPRCAFGLGELYAFRGDPEHAHQWMSYYQDHRTGPDPEADRISDSLNVTLLTKQASALQSESLFRQALALAQRTLGPDHPDTAGAMNNLASLLESQGNYTEAEPLYRRSLEICEKKLGPTDPHTAMALDNLAGVLEAKGDTATAESMYRRALSIAETTLGPTDPTTKTIRQDLNNLRK